MSKKIFQVIRVFAVFMLSMTIALANTPLETEIQRFTGSDSQTGDVFEHPMSVYGNTAVFCGKFNNAVRGAAYVYERIDGQWVEQQKITASDAAPFRFFGTAIDLDADTIVVGATNGVNANGVNSGSVYVFEKVNGVWVETQKLSDDISGVARDGFGINVAIDGDTIAVGAHAHDGVVTDGGLVYIYKKIDGIWVETSRFAPTDLVENARFGFNIDLENGTLVVGAPVGGFRTVLNGIGSVYIFKELPEGNWVQQAKLTDNIDKGGFGWTTHMHGNTLVVGATGSDFVPSGSSTHPGAVHVYNRSGNTWTETQVLTSSNGTMNDRFGLGLAVFGNTIVAGAHGHNTARGEAYVFKFMNGQWSETRRLHASNEVQGTAFGEAVGINGTSILIGATNLDNSIPQNPRPFVGPGEVYVFDNN